MNTEMSRQFDPRRWISLDHQMPENPKIIGLSDAAFRLYIEALCYCSRNQTDGSIPPTILRRLSSIRTAPNELEKAGLIEGGQIHDYLKHQRSRAEIAESRSSAASRGSLGSHRRWHVERGITEPDCPHCRPDIGIADSHS